MRFRTPIAEARGLGSAKDGTHHWWMQRVTAVALVPLGPWFVIALVGLTGASHAEVVAWMASPLVTVLLVFLVAALFHHAQLGVQVVIEDYVHGEAAKIASLVALKLAAVLLALVCVVAVLRVSLGAGA